jgi:hypothetical protein
MGLATKRQTRSQKSRILAPGIANLLIGRLSEEADLEIGVPGSELLPSYASFNLWIL